MVVCVGVRIKLYLHGVRTESGGEWQCQVTAGVMCHKRSGRGQWGRKRRNNGGVRATSPPSRGLRGDTARGETGS
ncbi:hypothetical protein Pmani_018042 [Petrolisthes manimaculis]|uniref:Uncharacterized protein n=1 Tax=Petrolisthes manimaculis TaxID=1843537 RepID=A0AAE1PKK1_9EUCA|nr:hypothetical protein Pmani_018042 [Petrolisthes manimaculis]